MNLPKIRLDIIYNLGRLRSAIENDQLLLAMELIKTIRKQIEQLAEEVNSNGN